MAGPRIIGIVCIVIAAAVVASILNEKEKIISDLKQENEKIGREAVEEYRTLNETNKRLQEIVDKYNAEKELPEVPVVIWFRQPYFGAGNGQIAEIKNGSRAQLRIHGSIIRPSEDRPSEVATTRTIHSFDISLPTFGTVTLGEDNGWAFEVGDIVTIGLPQHRPRTFIVY